MLDLAMKVLFFRIREIYFSEYPYDVEGCPFVHFPSCKNKVEADGFTRVDYLTSVIDLTQDLDTIWRKLDYKSSRLPIKRAQREGIKVNINRDYDEFWQINRSFQRKKGFGPILGIGTPRVEIMKRYGTLFTAEYEGEILGGNIYLEDEANIRAWRWASTRLKVDREKAALIGRANRLLCWEAIQYAKEKGMKEFDWAGLASKEEANRDKGKKGRNSYKLSFGGEIVTRYSYRKISSKAYKLSYFLYNLANSVVGKVRER
ncbi:hypothetical protein ACFLX7_00985 [Chloroflexota bacterium]